MPLYYRIHMLSAASMLGYAEQSENGYRYCPRMQLEWYGNRRGT